MKLLLDTHVFLWFISGDKQLSEVIKMAICRFDNEVYLSVVSLWEVIIKQDLGKLFLPQPAQSYLPTQRKRHHIASVPINEASVAQLAKLPSIHRDPFDRMLICQAIEYDLTIITIDNIFHAYPVKLFNPS